MLGWFSLNSNKISEIAIDRNSWYQSEVYRIRAITLQRSHKQTHTLFKWMIFQRICDSTIKYSEFPMQTRSFLVLALHIDWCVVAWSTRFLHWFQRLRLCYLLLILQKTSEKQVEARKILRVSLWFWRLILIRGFKRCEMNNLCFSYFCTCLFSTY